MMRFDYEYVNHGFSFFLDGNEIVIATDTPDGKETRSIKCIENSHYTIKFNKKSLSGIGGAYGIFRFLEKCAADGFMTAYIEILIKKSFGLEMDLFDLTDKELSRIQCVGMRGAKEVAADHGFPDLLSYKFNGQELSPRKIFVLHSPAAWWDLP